MTPFSIWDGAWETASLCLTTDPTTGKTYAYSSENLLTSASGGVTLSYDPLGRLYQSNDGATIRRFHYAIGESGLYEAVGEYDPMGSVRSHHAFGPGVDEPILWWDGTQSFAIKPLHADERGSIVAISDSAGAAATINRYDEFGKPQPGNVGMFQYTGQMWRPEIGLYHYKARAYAPHLGRFMQTDPIGMAGGVNLYAYVGNDPVNMIDPRGERCYAFDIGYGWYTPSGGYLGPAPGRFYLPVCTDYDDTGFGPAPSPSDGGAAAPGGIQVGPPPPPSTPCIPTEDQLEDSGPVTFAGISSDTYLLLGYGGTYGRFTTESGLSGDFVATAFGFGLGASYQVGGGFANSLAEFIGGSDNVNLGTPFGEFSFSKGLNSDSWSFSSFGYGGSYGTASALKNALGPLGIATAISPSITLEVTEISNVSCPLG